MHFHTLSDFQKTFWKEKAELFRDKRTRSSATCYFFNSALAESQLSTKMSFHWTKIWTRPQVQDESSKVMLMTLKFKHMDD